MKLKNEIKIETNQLNQYHYNIEATKITWKEKQVEKLSSL